MLQTSHMLVDSDTVVPMFSRQEIIVMVEHRDTLESAAKPFRSLLIRQAIDADCVELADIYNDAIRSGKSTMDTQPVDAGYFQHILAQQMPREVLIVGEVNTKVVAWGIVKRYSNRPGYRYACETSVFVANGQQRQGIGSAILKAIVEHASGLGYQHLVAKIFAVNEASVRFHERFGYEIVGRQRSIGMLNGVWHDVVIMQHVANEE